MREVKHYICEICGTEYKDKKKAQDCEKHHCKAVTIKKARYTSFDNNKKGYPVSIDIEMADGTVVTYKR